MIDLPVIAPQSTQSSNAGEKRWQLDFAIGKEVSITRLLRTLTFKRLWNVAQILASFIISAVTKRNVVWGVAPILTVEPTNLCNLRCPLCVTGNGSMMRPTGMMDFDTFKRLIEDLGDRIMYIVLYQQGEPYLNRDFNKFVAYATQRRIYVTTSTNAHYFDERNAEAVVRSGLDTMIVSVDGVTQESYERYRVGGSLDKVMQGIRNLVAAKRRLRSKTPYIYLQFIIMRHNEHELEQMAQLSRDLGCDRFLKKTVQVENLEEAIAWLPSADRHRRYDLTDEQFTVKRGGKGVCPRPWLTTLVNWDGTVVPCCFDKNGNHTTGDMQQTDHFVAIWQSDEYNRFRQQMLSDRNAIDICKNCNQGIGLFI